MATYRHTHTKQARRAKAHGPSTLINFNTDALGGGSAGGISNFPVITETRGNYVCVVWTAVFRKETVGGTLVRHVVQPQISGSTLCKARNRDIFVCKSTVRMRRARRSAGQTGHRGRQRRGSRVIRGEPRQGLDGQRPTQRDLCRGVALEVGIHLA